METRLARRLASKTDRPVEVKLVPTWRRPLGVLTNWHWFAKGADDESESDTINSHARNTNSRLRTDMIRRMDDAPKLINPSGWISEGRPNPPRTPASDTRVMQASAELRWSVPEKAQDAAPELSASEASESSDEDVKRRANNMYVLCQR